MTTNKINKNVLKYGLFTALFALIPAFTFAESQGQTQSLTTSTNVQSDTQSSVKSSDLPYPTDAVKNIFKDIRNGATTNTTPEQVEKRKKDIEILKAYIAQLKSKFLELQSSSSNSSNTDSTGKHLNIPSAPPAITLPVSNPSVPSTPIAPVNQKPDDYVDTTNTGGTGAVNVDGQVPHRYIDDMRNNPVNTSTDTNTNVNTDTNTDSSVKVNTETEYDNRSDVSSRIYSEGAMSALVYDSGEDRAGTWGRFYSGSGFAYESQPGSNDIDWLWKVNVRVSESKAIKSITVYHEGSNQVWSTSDYSNFPIVVFYEGRQYNHKYNDVLPRLDNGLNTLKLYGQKDNKNQPGTNIRIEFTDGTYLNSGIGRTDVE